MPNVGELSTIKEMARFLTFLVCLLPLIPGVADAATGRSALSNATSTARGATVSNFVSPRAYETMYPAMNNTMKTELNPGTTPSFSGNPVSTLTRTSGSDARKVVARSGARSASTATVAPTSARSGVPTTTSGGNNVARAAANNTSVSSANGTSGGNAARRVVSRGNFVNNATVRSGRNESSYMYRLNENAANTIQSTTESLPADRCLADYTTCMNGYCQRESTAYNRCYCSSRLAQIDATYQPAIDSLIKQILTLTGTNQWSQDEMNDYWDDIIGKHTGDNSWVNLENALDINWADTESRVRGQNSFVIGHDYCVQHLRGCYYMESNMRDAYRSDIARDCAVYENSLQKIKTVAESFVESYNE